MSRRDTDDEKINPALLGVGWSVVAFISIIWIAFFLYNKLSIDGTWASAPFFTTIVILCVVCVVAFIVCLVNYFD